MMRPMFGHDRPRPKEFKHKTEGWCINLGSRRCPERVGLGWIPRGCLGVNQGKDCQEGESAAGHIPGRCPAAAIHWKSLHSSPGAGCHGGKGSPWQRKSDTGVEQGKSLTCTSQNMRGLDKAIFQVPSSPQSCLLP